MSTYRTVIGALLTIFTGSLVLLYAADRFDKMIEYNDNNLQKTLLVEEYEELDDVIKGGTDLLLDWGFGFEIIKDS